MRREVVFNSLLHSMSPEKFFPLQSIFRYISCSLPMNDLIIETSIISFGITFNITLSLLLLSTLNPFLYLISFHYPYFIILSSTYIAKSFYTNLIRSL